MNISQVKVSQLIPYEKNTKKHDKKQVNNVAKSIEQYGFVQPIVIDKNNVVIIGHCRLLAAKQLKLKEVPCVRVEDLTEEQVRKLRIVDNKSNESEWDLDFLADELGDLDFSDFEFDLKNHGTMESNITLEEVELKPYTKVHYLISVDLNAHDEIIKHIEQIKNIGDVEVESSLN